MQIAAIFLVLILFAGWPSVAFVHYRFRRGYSLAQALFLTTAPSLGSLFIPLLVSDGGLLPRHPAPWVGALALSFNLVWFAYPYFILARWAIRASRRSRLPPSTPIA